LIDVFFGMNYPTPIILLSKTADAGSRPPLKIDVKAPIMMNIHSGRFNFNMANEGQR
jgi:hypothetical protein